ncbi:hypothetical protein CEQ30_41050 [Nocardia brasiliensis]|nr:hypothetical protein CEQ30_41050 [Nocardia brasiliensis]
MRWSSSSATPSMPSPGGSPSAGRAAETASPASASRCPTVCPHRGSTRTKCGRPRKPPRSSRTISAPARSRPIWCSAKRPTDASPEEAVMNPLIIVGGTVLVFGLLVLVVTVLRRPTAPYGQLTVAALQARLAEENSPSAPEAEERLVELPVPEALQESS